jgi:hypothetical protein
VRYLSIKGFEKHQHYKNRNPPWIKLHRSTLSDYAFGCLQDASKAHLMLLWLLASGVDNLIPYDLPWIQKQLGANEPIDVEELILQGFIEVGQDDGKPLAERKQNARLVEESRGRGETETEKRRKKIADSGESDPKVSRLVLLPKAGCDALHAVWHQKFGAIDYGRFRKTILPIFEVPPESRPSVPETTEAIIAAWEWWIEQESREQGFFTLPKFVEQFGKWRKYGQMPLTDANGLTERGEWAGSKALRQQARERRQSA